VPGKTTFLAGKTTPRQKPSKFGGGIGVVVGYSVVAFVTGIVGMNVVVSDTQVVVGRGVAVAGGRVLMIGVQVSASPLMHSFSFRSKMYPAEQYLIVACFLSHFTYRSHLFG
jgi:hypothetical protein